MRTINHHTYKTTHGISMIELVVFILVMAIAFVGVMSVFVNTQRHSADPMIRIKTVELAQSLMDEIFLKGFDERTPLGGGCVQFPAGSSRCTAGPVALAATAASFQPDGVETRATFDDVDDYHNIAYCGAGVAAADASCTAACTNLADESGNNISTEYAGFSACIRLNFAGAEISPAAGVAVRANDAKRIDIIVTDPLNSRMTFSAYRLNF